ncbi:MAG: nucleotide exchange factor GrpE [Jejuia sp.]
MSKKNKSKDTVKEQVDGLEKEAVAVEEQQKQEVVKEPSAEEKLQEELQNEKDKFLRLFAEFENYKKRTSRERLELFKTAGKEIMIELLPVLDDFERALTHIEEDKEAEELRKGVLLIYQKLLSTLEKKGLSVVEVKHGDVFDAEIHTAITQIPAPSDDLKGKIIDVVEKGYKLGDTIIRFPKVVVGQ